MLNTILGSFPKPDRIADKSFPVLEKDDPPRFPEDFAVRGILWTEGYFPADFLPRRRLIKKKDTTSERR
jgi:hypothetical protein